jgi:uncharacterized protein (DUF433 family)
MTLTLAADPLPLRLDDRGAYRVGGTRVCLDTVVNAYNTGSTAEQIIQDYATLELSDVHAVISYYLRHKVDVDAYLAVRKAETDRLRSDIEALPQNKELRAKLIARRNQRS